MVCELMKRLSWAIAALAPLSLMATAPTVAQQNCDPSYPDVCITPPLPDLDCKDIPYDNFRVVGDDPHGFDRDNDGVGCETVWVPTRPTQAYALLIEHE